jgi:ABC-type uncharacterized transport system ATPase subunit
MLKIEHLTKNYGLKKAVDDLSLEIKDEKSMALSDIMVQGKQRH